MLFKLFSNFTEGTSTSGYIRLNGCAGEATGWSPTSRLLSQHSSVVKDFTYGARLFLGRAEDFPRQQSIYLIVKLTENMIEMRGGNGAAYGHFL